MVNGGLVEPETSHLALCALAADHYGIPVFQYMDHLRHIREQYGELAARFDLEFALAVRDLRIEKAKEAAKSQG